MITGMKTFRQYVNEITDPNSDEFLDYLDRSKTLNARGLAHTLDKRLGHDRAATLDQSAQLVRKIREQMLSFRAPDTSDDQGLQGTSLDKFLHITLTHPKQAITSWIQLKQHGTRPEVDAADEELAKIGLSAAGAGQPGSVSSGQIQQDKIDHMEQVARELDVRTLQQARVARRILAAAENVFVLRAEQLAEKHPGKNIWLARHVYADGSVPLQPYIDTDHAFDFHEMLTKPTMDQLAEAAAKHLI